MSTRRRIWVQSLEQAQREAAKPAFTTRRVPHEAMRTIIGGAIRPRSGDLVLARIARLGHHRHIEEPNGRRAVLHLGDEIIVAYGDRYATDQFESRVPGTLKRTQLVASGGIASQVLSRSQAVHSATDIVPVGLIGDDRGRPLNIMDFALDPVFPERARPRTIAVIGTAMNSGKTTTIHYLVHGLSRAGVRVGATKVTGTGSGNDYWCMLDAGADRMLDFTDVGMSSTYRQPMELLERKFAELVDHLTDAGSMVNFIEVADGIYQDETSRLLDCDVFHGYVDALIFAAPDAMGAAAGVSHLRSLGHNVVAVSGLVTRSPLATRETARATDLPVLGLQELSTPAMIADLLGIEPVLHVVSPKAEEPALARIAEKQATRMPSDERAALGSRLMPKRVLAINAHSLYTRGA